MKYFNIIPQKYWVLNKQIIKEFFLLSKRLLDQPENIAYGNSLKKYFELYTKHHVHVAGRVWMN